MYVMFGLSIFLSAFLSSSSSFPISFPTSLLLFLIFSFPLLSIFFSASSLLYSLSTFLPPPDSFPFSNSLPPFLSLTHSLLPFLLSPPSLPPHSLSLYQIKDTIATYSENMEKNCTRSSLGCWENDTMISMGGVKL